MTPDGTRGGRGTLEACDPVWQAYGVAIGAVAAFAVL
ncbi:hypothetical protein F4557_006356 [Actinomadura catellatispora]|uniref:Uncharacterized protein n=1 Tax=Actinomadura livida TaxID=79909 RepID=A0A7W7N0I6_9ACTN|nr:hypothetical protein [Actinomadura catellatispora]